MQFNIALWRVHYRMVWNKVMLYCHCFSAFLLKYSKTPIIWTLLSRLSIIQIGLAHRVNLSRILQINLP